MSVRACLATAAYRALGILMASTAGCEAGAWTKPSGEGQVIVTGLYAEALEGFDAAGDPYAIPLFRKADLDVYGEYGVTDWLTAIGRAEVKTRSSGELFALDEARFGLVGLGARARLWQGGGGAVSAEATGRISAGGLEGSEDGDLDLRLSAGYAFALGTWPSFAEAQGAYRLRFGTPSDEIRADLTLGIRPRHRLLLLAQSFNTVAAGSDGGPDGGPDGDGEAKRREHKLQLSAVYDLSSSLSLQFGGFATVAGRSAVRETGIVTAVWFRF